MKKTNLKHILVSLLTLNLSMTPVWAGPEHIGQISVLDLDGNIVNIEFDLKDGRTEEIFHEIRLATGKDLLPSCHLFHGNTKMKLGNTISDFAVMNNDVIQIVQRDDKRDDRVITQYKTPANYLPYYEKLARYHNVAAERLLAQGTAQRTAVAAVTNNQSTSPQVALDPAPVIPLQQQNQRAMANPLDTGFDDMFSDLANVAAVGSTNSVGGANGNNGRSTQYRQFNFQAAGFSPREFEANIASPAQRTANQTNNVQQGRQVNHNEPEL
jgi:hypothetical protein